VRKIKYKKGKKVVPTFLEYTGIHKEVATQMHWFVNDNKDLVECSDGHFMEVLKNVNKQRKNG